MDPLIGWALVAWWGGCRRRVLVHDRRRARASFDQGARSDSFRATAGIDHRTVERHRPRARRQSAGAFSTGLPGLRGPVLGRGCERSGQGLSREGGRRASKHPQHDDRRRVGPLREPQDQQRVEAIGAGGARPRSHDRQQCRLASGIGWRGWSGTWTRTAGSCRRPPSGCGRRASGASSNARCSIPITRAIC